MVCAATCALCACNSDKGSSIDNQNNISDNVDPSEETLSYGSLEELATNVPCNAESIGITRTVGIENVIYTCLGDYSTGFFNWVIYQDNTEPSNPNPENQMDLGNEYNTETDIVYEESSASNEYIFTEEQPLSSSETAQISSSSLQTSCTSPINNKVLTDERDGHKYTITTIGSQTWMAQNLSYKTEGSFCLEPADSCAKYGRLYTWADAIDSVKLVSDPEKPIECGYGKLCEFDTPIQGICPCGWHLPSETEWETLITKAGGRSVAGRTLKAQTDWETGFGDDTYGFKALPAGVRDTSGKILFVGSEAYFWSATSDFAYTAGYMWMYNHGMIALGDANMRYGYSVRCIKD